MVGPFCGVICRQRKTSITFFGDGMLRIFLKHVLVVVWLAIACHRVTSNRIEEFFLHPPFVKKVVSYGWVGCVLSCRILGGKE